jgi:tripartite ATP-independent transporter DctP family solute receptor
MLPPLPRRAFIAGSAAALATPHIARAAVRIVKVAQGSAPQSPAGIGALAFAQAVAASPVLGTVLKLDVHHGAELGDDLTSLKGCIDGTLDLALVGTTVASGIVPEIGVLDTPFLFPGIAAARAALDGAPGQDFLGLLKAKGINLLAWSENGVRHMTANKPIRAPSDLVGLKLRVPPSDIVMGAFRALGANAGQVPFPGLHEALRTGSFDAQENPIGLIESAGLYEVQKVLSLTGHAYSAGLIVVSPDLLDDLAPPQRVALQSCAVIGQNATRAAADAAQRDGVARLQGKGMAVIGDVDVAAFVAANKPYLTSIGQKFGADRIARLMQSGAG